VALKTNELVMVECKIAECKIASACDGGQTRSQAGYEDGGFHQADNLLQVAITRGHKALEAHDF
jgi:hypothetical protein